MGLFAEDQLRGHARRVAVEYFQKQRATRHCFCVLFEVGVEKEDCVAWPQSDRGRLQLTRPRPHSTSLSDWETTLGSFVGA